MKLETTAFGGHPKRTYRFGTVASFEDVPEALHALSPHFVLLLAVDATRLSDDTLRMVARTVLGRGLAYLCIWGADCSRVHDQFDLERDPAETEGTVVPTTWHDNEPLEEAVWYFAHNAYPSDDFDKSCQDWVALSIGNDEWEQELRKSFAEINSESERT